MKILGISAYYHDSSAALMVDGTIIAAAQEERFTRIKHDNSFPVEACRYCLKEANISLSDIDIVVFYEKPFLKFERLLVSHIVSFPKSLSMFLRTMPVWLKDKLNMRKCIRKTLKREFGVAPKEIKFVEHHLSHAAFALGISGFANCDILVVDAVGEWATTSIMRSTEKSIQVISEQRFPDSIGLLYSSFTQFLGFKVNSDEYKVMGLAPYGNEKNEEVVKIIQLIKQHIVTIQRDGAIVLNLDYFQFQYGEHMINQHRWEDLFGIPQRFPSDEIEQSHMNLAHAIQLLTEEILLKLITSIKKESDNNSLCICGGVALNCAANGRLLNSGIYKDIFVPFAPGDCGCSIGAAMAYDMLSSDRKQYPVSPYLGPEFSDKHIEHEIKKSGLKYEWLSDNNELCATVASLIAAGHIIGWFQWRMELGPRALGNRSILADARQPEMKKVVNARIKFRESFRPFAPAIMEEYAESYFDIQAPSPYMMLTYKVKTDSVPSITHKDGSARVQTVSNIDNPLFHKLLEKFHEQTGCPLLLNTSFNVMGEPIVCSPSDALRTFMNSGLDYLAIGNFLIRK